MNIEKKLISMNYSKGVTITPKYIVIHETDNTNKGANALAHFNYWNTNPNANSSVHFVVDDERIIQLAELNWRCWHVGDNKGHSNITNDNTIGIEICVNSDGNYTKARQNAIELVKYLIPVTGIPASRVVRHYDASGKRCPRKMLDNPSLWTDFKKAIQGQPAPTPSGLYRVRKSWDDAKSQIGAYAVLANAKAACDKNPGCFVFDEGGKVVYPIQTPAPEQMYRVRKTWSDAKSQVGAYKVLDNAISKCKEYPGYSVYDEAGKAIYTSPGAAAPAEPEPKPEPKPEPEPKPDPGPKGGTPIRGQSVATVEQLVMFVLNSGKEPALNCSLQYLAQLFIDEGEMEGIKGDMAFAQAVKETNYFTFLRPDGTSSLVLPEQNNFCGLGATNNSDIGKGAWFSTPKEGVRAQIQHLKGYASTEPLSNLCVDPRFGLVQRGVAPCWEDLNGRWAVPGNGYGESIVDIHRRILETKAATPEGPPQHDDFEGFRRIAVLLFEKLLGWVKKLLKS
jgi:hypothetical protein